MTGQFIAFVVLEAALAVLVGGAVVSWLRRRDHRLVREFMDRTRRDERARNDFRRPKEFGPLTLAWDRLEEMRLSIFVEQASGWGDQRYSKWTEDDKRWRAWDWSQHLSQDGLFAMTGRGIAA